MKRKALNGEPITAKKMGTQKSKSQKQTFEERALGREGMSQKTWGVGEGRGGGREERRERIIIIIIIITNKNKNKNKTIYKIIKIKN